MLVFNTARPPWSHVQLVFGSRQDVGVVQCMSVYGCVGPRPERSAYVRLWVVLCWHAENAVGRRRAGLAPHVLQCTCALLSKLLSSSAIVSCNLYLPTRKLSFVNTHVFVLFSTSSSMINMSHVDHALREPADAPHGPRARGPPVTRSDVALHASPPPPTPNPPLHQGSVVTVTPRLSHSRSCMSDQIPT
jgi:hypothetical protein